MNVPLHKRLASKLTALSVLLVVITIGYFAISIYVRDFRILERRFGRNLQHIVASAATQINGAQHRRIRSPRDAKSPAFLQIQQILRRVQKYHRLRADHIHTFHVVGPYKLQYAVMLHPEHTIGSTHTIVAKTNRKAFRTMQLKKIATRTRTYSDKHGMWISAYAPILDKDQQIAGVLEAAVQLDSFFNILQSDLRWLLLLSLSAVLLAILLSLLFAQGLNRDLKRLLQGVDAIKVHDYNYHIKLERKDELGAVAEQFNQMADVIAERVDMLKYLPKHTLEAIARRSRTGAVYETEYVKGTVVYTQLRGYSSFSETLSPEQIIETLNRILRHQAEVLDLYGGVIDKLIGDGVLAVFTDFAHVHRAVEAGVDLQKAAAELNDSEELPIPLHLGVGIATGYLVFGEVGSELRKERILLGSEVNLAARLSNLADDGEVIVSDQVRHQLAKALEISRTQEIQLPGLQEPQIIHAVSQIKAFASQQTWTT